MVLALPSAAQDYDRPPAGYGDNPGGGYGTPDPGDGGYGVPADRPDPAGLSVRVGRLEGRIRDMTGQIEELQNANRKLVEQLQKFQEDVDSRMASGHVKRSEATVPDTDRSASASDTPPKPSARKARGDSFDPDAAPPSDPGQPKALGSVAAAQSDDAPMDLAGSKLRHGGENADTIAPTLRLPPRPSTDAAPPSGTEVASATPTTPREFYEQALGYYRDKQYDDAEKGFSAFIQKNPKSKLVADATYYLGESFAQRGRSREAAEQYLKISTDYASSTRAPDAMLHLGMSLKALGAKEQACATFAEVSRKYPNAPAYVRSGADREAKRAQCAG